MPTGKWEKYIAIVEEICNLREVQRSSTRTTMTSPQSLDTWSRKTAAVEPSTELRKDKKMYYQAKRMLQKARQGKHGRHPTILWRWNGFEDYRNSLSATRWKEHHITLYDRIAMEKHIYIATRAERIQFSKHWILTANAEGRTQQSLIQRPETNQTHGSTNWERPRGTTRGIKKEVSICQFLLHVRTWWVFPCWGTLSRRLHSWVLPV